MKHEDLLEQMKSRMPQKRFIHTRGVAETAIQLAELYGKILKKQRLRGFCMIV